MNDQMRLEELEILEEAEALSSLAMVDRVEIGWGRCSLSPGWDVEVVFEIEDCEASIEVEGENLKECIKIIREEAEAGFPNVNEHGEYYHHIIKEEAS